MVRVVYIVWRVRTSACFHMFFACDGGGAADLPQRVHLVLLLAAVSSTFHMLASINM